MTVVDGVLLVGRVLLTIGLVTSFLTIFVANAIEKINWIYYQKKRNFFSSYVELLVYFLNWLVVLNE